MFNSLVPVVVTYIVFSTIYKLFELFARRKERMALIDKIAACDNPAQSAVEFSLNIENSSKYSSIKWGCLLLGIGLGILFAFFVNINCIYIMQELANVDGSWRLSVSESQGIVYMASMLLFGGIALIIAFIIELRLRGSSGDKKC